MIIIVPFQIMIRLTKKTMYTLAADTVINICTNFKAAEAMMTIRCKNNSK